MKFFTFSLLVLVFMATGCTKTETTKANSPATNAAANANTPTKPEPSGTLDELAVARTNYKEKCARCHQPDGTGGKVDIEGTTINAKNLTKLSKDPDQELIDAIEGGFPDDGMPAFKGKLSEQEIKDLVKFIRTEFQK